MIDVRLDSPRPRWQVIAGTVTLHLATLLALLPVNFSWGAVGVAVFLHWLTIGLGISLGCHRLATHRSFKVSQGLEYFFVLCGTLAGQGGVLVWIGYHRMHHLYADRAGDPHDSTQGFWWSHISWLMHVAPPKTELRLLTRDCADDAFYQFCHKHYLGLQVALAIILYGLGGIPFVIWGIFVRLFVGFHSTCFVNSACHKFGDRSRHMCDRQGKLLVGGAADLWRRLAQQSSCLPSLSPIWLALVGSRHGLADNSAFRETRIRNSYQSYQLEIYAGELNL